MGDLFPPVVSFYTCKEGSFSKPPSKPRNLLIYGWWPHGHPWQGGLIFEAHQMYAGHRQFSTFHLTTRLTWRASKM